jgi:hypothetical protein
MERVSVTTKVSPLLESKINRDRNYRGKIESKTSQFSIMGISMASLLFFLPFRLQPPREGPPNPTPPPQPYPQRLSLLFSGMYLLTWISWSSNPPAPRPNHLSTCLLAYNTAAHRLFSPFLLNLTTKYRALSHTIYQPRKLHSHHTLHTHTHTHTHANLPHTPA